MFVHAQLGAHLGTGKKKDNTNTIGPISLTAVDRNSTADDRIPILRG